jgi:hypothetical protein
MSGELIQQNDISRIRRQQTFIAAPGPQGQVTLAP